MIIEIEHLYKDFGADHMLKDINLNINQGIFGIWGPIGSGKTTLLKIAAGLKKKSRGQVKIDGVDMEKNPSVLAGVRYVPADFSGYPMMSVYEILDYLAVISGLGLAKIRRQRILGILKQVMLENFKKVKVNALPLSMKKRLGIAAAFLNNPELVIIDDLFEGIDCDDRTIICEILGRLSGGKTVIISASNRQVLEGVCDRISSINDGVLCCDKSCIPGEEK